MNLNIKHGFKKTKIIWFKTKTKVKRDKVIETFFDWLRFVIEYGVATNIVLTGLFNFRFDVMSVLGLGILWFFIKYEVPRVKREWSR